MGYISLSVYKKDGAVAAASIQEGGGLGQGGGGAEARMNCWTCLGIFGYIGYLHNLHVIFVHRGLPYET